MQKRILFFLLLLTTYMASGQINKPSGTTGAGSPVVPIVTPGAYNNDIKLNYVRTWEAKGPYQDPGQMVAAGYQHVQQTTAYVDGLGRPLQTVTRQVTPQGKDIVSPVTYDEFGREALKFIPYVSTTSDGSFRIDPFNEQKTYLSGMYAGEQVFYSQTTFEASPLNRVLQTAAAGNSWTGSNKGVSQKYLFNTAAEGIRIWRIGNDALTYSGNDITTNIPISGNADVYGAGQLYKNVTIDEAGHAVVEYKDKEGRVVLKKVQVADQLSGFDGHEYFLCTYYVYDDLNQLRFVIPPKAVEAIKGAWSFSNTGGTDIINELCFRYEYDYRGRMIAKKVPGAGWVYMVYDIRDRLVFTQDGNLRQKNPAQWMTTLYDALNRPVLTGVITLTSQLTPAALQTQVSSTTSQAPVNNNFPVDLVLNGNLDGVHQAMNSITIEGEAQTVVSGDFTAAIADGPGGGDGMTTYYEGVAVNKSPILVGASFVPLTITYYDNYEWTNKAFSTAYSSLLDAGSNLHAETMPTQRSLFTTGMVTGSKIRIIENPDNLSAGGWLSTVSFYDDKGRVIQTQGDNYKGGTDIATNRYDFTGKVLSSYLAHNNPAAGTTGQVNVLTRLHYDHAGRLLDIKKQVNGGSEVYVTRNTYDELGQLQNKSLGQGRDNAGNYTNIALETLNYDYNVRGWLKGINKDYAAGNGQHKFGMELSYDWGFENNQLNGNVAGIKWRSMGDQEQRAYGFGYDPVNRLLKADFTQNNSGWNTSAGMNFSMQMGDGTTASSAYDENGNIKGMKQWGWKQGNSSVIDDLAYSYFSNSNKLQSVTENATGGGKLGEQPTGLGDFTDKNTAGADYGYDLNGNMISDLNKKIMGNTGIDQANGGAIRYNHLNLPWQIAVKKDDNSEKGNITYIYDVAGNKLEKKVSENNIVKTTTYIGDFVYEDNKLQSLAHEEGRVRFTPAEGVIAAHFDYDYFVKDHQNSVRMVLTDEVQTIYYPAATLEGNYNDPNASSMVNHEKKFFNIDNSYITLTNSIPSWGTATGIGYENNNGNPPVNSNYPSGTTPSQTGVSERLYKLNAATNKTGLQFVLKVMSGDHLDIFGKSYYHSNQTFNNSNSTLLDIGTIMAGVLLPPGSAAGSKGMTSGNLTSLNDLLLPGSFIRGNNGESVQIPKAYINYILLDEQFRYVAGGASRVGSSDDVKSHWQSDPSLRDIEINKNGYLYVYVSNESNIDVFFDNLQIVHRPGPLLEEAHYYPFGLIMDGISSRKKTHVSNKEKTFQEQRFDDDLGIDVYSFKYRNEDRQTGRFWQVDPLSDQYVHNSTYAFSENKVTSHAELEGLEAQRILDGFWRQVSWEFIGTARKVDRIYENKESIDHVTSKQKVGQDIEVKNSVETTTTRNLSFGLGDYVEHVVRTNSSVGAPSLKIEMEEKVEVKDKTTITTKLGKETITGFESVSRTDGSTETGVSISGPVKLGLIPNASLGFGFVTNDKGFSTFSTSVSGSTKIGKTTYSGGVEATISGQHRQGTGSFSLSVFGQSVSGDDTKKWVHKINF